MFIYYHDTLGLRQCNGLANTNNKLLYLILTNNCEISVNAPSITLVKEDICHGSVLFEVNLMPRKCNRYLTPIIHFRHADYNSINTAFSSVDWENLFKDNDIDQCADRFLKKYMKLSTSTHPFSHTINIYFQSGSKKQLPL